MKWKVNCSALKDDDATHPGFEIVTADLKRIEDGALCFYRIAPDDSGTIAALNALTHIVASPQWIDVRGFNAVKWDDYVIVEEE